MSAAFPFFFRIVSLQSPDSVSVLGDDILCSGHTPRAVCTCTVLTKIDPAQEESLWAYCKPALRSGARSSSSRLLPTASRGQTKRCSTPSAWKYCEWIQQLGPPHSARRLGVDHADAAVESSLRKISTVLSGSPFRLGCPNPGPMASAWADTPPTTDLAAQTQPHREHSVLPTCNDSNATARSSRH